MVRTYSKRIEIVFWDFMIPLMSESRLVQAILPTALALAHRKESLLRMGKLFAWAWVGLILGLLLGFIRSRMG